MYHSIENLELNYSAVHKHNMLMTAQDFYRVFRPENRAQVSPDRPGRSELPEMPYFS